MYVWAGEWREMLSCNKNSVCLPKIIYLTGCKESGYRGSVTEGNVSIIVIDYKSFNMTTRLYIIDLLEKLVENRKVLKRRGILSRNEICLFSEHFVLSLMMLWIKYFYDLPILFNKCMHLHLINVRTTQQNSTVWSYLWCVKLDDKVNVVCEDIFP